MNNYITLYGEPLEYPHQVSVDKRGVAYYEKMSKVRSKHEIGFET